MISLLPLLFQVPVPRTEVGTVIHFPSKLADDWRPAEAAAASVVPTFGPGAWLRFDGLWHEMHWTPDAPANYRRLDRLVGIAAANGLRPLLVLIPLPWPGSGWLPKEAPWGAVPDAAVPKIAARFAEDVAAYRRILAGRGIPENRAGIEFGNEPASGHPGGDPRLPQGTWSGGTLWSAMSAAADYGELKVVSPSLSMQDFAPEIAARERESATVGASGWSRPVTSLGLHNRVYRPDLGADAYATEYARVLQSRAAATSALDWGAAKGKPVSVTEGYVAPGDASGGRAAAIGALARRIKEGIPGVDLFLFYRWFPEKGYDGVAWMMTPADRAALKAIFNP